LILGLATPGSSDQNSLTTSDQFLEIIQALSTALEMIDLDSRLSIAPLGL